MISIATKVKLITIVLSITMVFNIFVTYYLVQDEKEDAKIINIAGKQRMLTQKMIAEFYRLNSDAHYDTKAFFQAQKSFNINLERLRSGDLSLDDNQEVSILLDKVEEGWKTFESLMLESIHKDPKTDLNAIYIKGNLTLALMEEAVLAYERNATSKRDFINQIQLVLGVFALFVILYMGVVSLGIHTQLNRFLKHSSDISGRAQKSKGSELELACEHIQYFLDDVEAAIDSATQAVQQSEKAAIQLSLVKQDPQEIKHLDKSEDIVIEANEELYKTSMLLKKLKTKLQDAANPNFR